jgi:hypothetical protein
MTDQTDQTDQQQDAGEQEWRKIEIAHDWLVVCGPRRRHLEEEEMTHNQYGWWPRRKS